MPIRAITLSLLLFTALGQLARCAAPPIDPQADDALKRMSAALAGAKAFSCDVHSTAEQITADGQLVDFARNQKILVRHPDRLAATVAGDQEDFQFFYDGAHVTLFNPRGNVYATIDTPPALDKTMDMLATRYGMTAPLADLLFDNPYQVLTENVTAGRYLGQGYVFDTPCHHIACTQKAVDWQMWIDAGDKPLPRKIVITYKLLPGQPRYTAFLSNWNLSPDTPDSSFTFTPPAGAKPVPWASPTTRPAADAPAPAK